MGSLQDQLLQSGLVSEEQLKKSRQDSARKRKGKPRKSKAERAKAPASEAARAARARDAEQKQRDRALDQARNTERDRRARLGQVRAIIDAQRLNDPQGDIKHFYQSGRKIKQIWVTDAQQQDLVAGRLVIAVLEGRGHLLRPEQAVRLEKVDPDGQHIRLVRTEPPAADDAPAADDPYADHPIPDDLMW